MHSIEERLGARLASKLQQNVGYRADMHLSDHRMAGADLANICIAYDAGVGRPSVQDIQDFITASFNGQVIPHMSTTRIHTANSAITLNVSQAAPCRDLKDREAMVPVGVNRYVEAATNDVWEVQDNEGTPALYRVAEEDLDEILRVRREQTTSRYASSKARLAKVMDDARVMVIPGADVLFFNQHGEEKVGRVMSEPDDHGYFSVTITGQEKGTRIHENQVHEMVRTAELDANTKKLLLDYYSQVFGAEYANKLVQEHVSTGTKEELVAFLTESGVANPHQAIAFVDTCRINSGTVATVGNNDMVLARYNGTGYEWQVDIEKAEQVLAASLKG